MVKSFQVLQCVVALLGARNKETRIIDLNKYINKKTEVQTYTKERGYQRNCSVRLSGLSAGILTSTKEQQLVLLIVGRVHACVGELP